MSRKSHAAQQKSSFWKTIRIIALLMVLLVVVLGVWRDKNQNWNQAIFVALYPVNADQSATTQSYISQLNEQDFIAIANYLQQQANLYHQPVQFYFRLGAEVTQLPPQVPNTTSVFSIMLWSLKFRYYAWQQQQNIGIKPDLTLFLNYYDPHTRKVLKHSTALQNGRIGIVNLFADAKQESQNKIVIAHEMLHAFGATDKYDLSTGQPIYPQGYGNPEQQPVHPQTTAELMAGHIALSQSQSKMADSLKQVVINQNTAQEVGWFKP